MQYYAREFESLYAQLADGSNPAAQVRAGIELVPLVGRAIFVETQGWLGAGLQQPQLKRFELGGRTYAALAAGLAVDIEAIPQLGSFDPGTCGIFLLRPQDPQHHAITVVYELECKGHRKAGTLELRWLELTQLCNVIRSVLVNNAPLSYSMEHKDMMEGAYSRFWVRSSDPPMDAKLLEGC